jgi:dihydroxy-acid dehydratase
LTIDAQQQRVDVAVSAAELKKRRRAWKPRRPYATQGVLAKYARVVSSASEGAVTDR